MRMSMRWFGIMLILLALPLTATAQVKAPPQGKINLEPAVSYEKSIELPYRGFSEDEVKVIDEVSDWQAVNDPDYRIFYVHPGDYREAGRITLTASGKEGRPRWLIYRDPENPKDTTTHPYHMDKDRQVLIDHLELDGASHWVVDRLRWHRMTRVVNGSSHNIFNRCLALQIDTSRGRQCMVIRSNSNHNTVQNCVFANTPPMPGKDCCGIYIRNADYTHVVNNEIFNMPGDSIQTGQARQHARGTVIQGNDLYVTPRIYTDGEGNFTREGNYAASENAIDIKAHWQPYQEVAPEDNWLIIENNRMWGFRRTDSKAGSTGSGGTHVVIHYTTSSAVRVRNNVMFNGRMGLGVSKNEELKLGPISHHDVHNNLFWDLQIGMKPRHIDQALYYRNVLVDVDRWLTMWESDDSKPRDNLITHNVIIDGEEKGVNPESLHDSNRIGANAFYNTPSHFAQASQSIVKPTASAARHRPIELEVKRITDPTVITIPHARVTDQGPHATWFRRSN